MNISRSAYVYVNSVYAGILAETDAGYSFSYDAAYIAGGNGKPVSLTLPLKQEAYFSKTLFPFFDGLIPEGWLLNIVSRNWKINTQDRFGLLLVACKDVVGNVSIREERL